MSPALPRNWRPLLWSALAVCGALLCGCSKTEPPAPASEGGNEGPPMVLNRHSAPSRPAVRPNDARHLPFEQATTAAPPREAFRPPDLTKAGKSVGKLYEQIAGKGGLWEQILFVDGDGKEVVYTVTLSTDLGDMSLELWPDIAPNHVRNFLALVKAGYHDGLVFHTTTRQQYHDEKGAKQIYELIEGGCPLGSGEPGYGSLGYWLKPELQDPAKNPKVTHGEGTLGAWHGDELDTAACKFYITLSKAPWMDGSYTVFGKVRQGLDVARKILERPTQTDEGLPDRPREPVVIRRAIVSVASRAP